MEIHDVTEVTRGDTIVYTSVESIPFQYRVAEGGTVAPNSDIVTFTCDGAHYPLSFHTNGKGAMMTEGCTFAYAHRPGLGEF
ncbi:MAG: hypothetical protein UHD09_02775 [Bifidobacterium sp.]|nr:hypothetical protein [Bifidobacterium sp.]